MFPFRLNKGFRLPENKHGFQSLKKIPRLSREVFQQPLLGGGGGGAEMEWICIFFSGLH